MQISSPTSPYFQTLNKLISTAVTHDLPPSLSLSLLSPPPSLFFSYHKLRSSPLSSFTIQECFDNTNNYWILRHDNTNNHFPQRVLRNSSLLSTMLSISSMFSPNWRAMFSLLLSQIQERELKKNVIWRRTRTKFDLILAV